MNELWTGPDEIHGPIYTWNVTARHTHQPQVANVLYLRMSLEREQARTILQRSESRKLATIPWLHKLVVASGNFHAIATSHWSELQEPINFMTRVSLTWYLKWVYWYVSNCLPHGGLNWPYSWSLRNNFWPTLRPCGQLFACVCAVFATYKQTRNEMTNDQPCNQTDLVDPSLSL